MTRSGWTHEGKHFTRTTNIRGRVMFFIDGKPTAKADWYAAFQAAKAADAENGR